MRRLKLYLDTSVISALFDESAPEIMRWTREFWQTIDKQQSYISDVVIAEILETPDPKLKEQMSDAIRGLPTLQVDENAEKLSNEYVKYGAVPHRYGRDALHIAITVINHIEILVSWNYRHIVRRRTREVVRMVNSLHDYPFVEIVAPPEILGSGRT